MEKLKKISVLAMLLISLQVAAQERSFKVAGLYKSYEDFVSNKLTYPMACNLSEGAIKTDQNFASSKISIKENGKKFNVYKKDFFGFADCDKTAFRFFENNAYQIIDTAGFYMYKRTGMKSGKGYAKISTYYFSKGATTQLERLTHENLRNTFSSNPKFLYELERDCKNDTELSEYVGYLKSFKVKYVFNETENK
jgi:hypothetical protein